MGRYTTMSFLPSSKQLHEKAARSINLHYPRPLGFRPRSRHIVTALLLLCIYWYSTSSSNAAPYRNTRSPYKIQATFPIESAEAQATRLQRRDEVKDAFRHARRNSRRLSRRWRKSISRNQMPTKCLFSKLRYGIWEDCWVRGVLANINTPYSCKRRLNWEIFLHKLSRPRMASLFHFTGGRMRHLESFLVRTVS